MVGESEADPEPGDIIPWDWNVSNRATDQFETPDLTKSERQQLLRVIQEFEKVLGPAPGRTTVIEHSINVAEEVPIHQKPYRVPYSKREVVKAEIQKMLEAKVIRPSTSPWASPIVLVEKIDGTVWFCMAGSCHWRWVCTARSRKAPKPLTKRAFLGLVGYYRRFVPEFSEVASPLTDLTKKRMPDKDFLAERSFQSLKDSLVKSPVLRVADPTKPFTLQTDASERGLGAVLSQADSEGKDHTVVYASRKLHQREQNYATIEKECLAIVWALKIFHTYLYGQNFLIQTDHQPLTWLHRMKNANARLTCWSLAIQPYLFKVTH